MDEFEITAVWTGKGERAFKRSFPTTQAADTWVDRMVKTLTPGEFVDVTLRQDGKLFGCRIERRA